MRRGKFELEFAGFYVCTLVSVRAVASDRSEVVIATDIYHLECVDFKPLLPVVMASAGNLVSSRDLWYRVPSSQVS